ncbi:two-component system sensor histidine kinase NtrB [Breznakiella homolactica]|uniref:histidine kinase n=1 Tax=Breznakiella homolactica TaxID=2798577 RepID=A0A7T7XKT8_9SPIR|nr:ATP-binding protein [Breznakiella homolactica]QQO08229.1 PAS domain-containing sensor histidine kinase [Breznakiella homolactica]
MRNFIERALKKLPKMTSDQIEALLVYAAEEIDRLESVLDSLNEGVLVCDKNHNLILINKFAERFLPIGLYEPGIQAIWHVIRDDKVADFLQVTLLNGDRVHDREFNVEAKGIQRLLSISVLPLVKEHQVTGSLILVDEITEKRAKEARLRRAENLASLTTLAAGVAHEIKNPLGSISIHIQLIQKAIDANRDIYTEALLAQQGETKEGPMEYFNLLDKYLDVVNEEIDRLNHIVVDFLFAVRPMNIEPREGDINTLIQELLEFVQYELDAWEITPELNLSRDLPIVEFDERYMKQALLNLIKNAMAAMPGGGTLTIKTDYDDTDIFIHICDTGIGIPEENLSKIFEPYFTTKETGSGLGLTMVFKIIKEHQGEISVTSRDGEGSCFLISLPRPQGDTRLIPYTEEAEHEI